MKTKLFHLQKSKHSSFSPGRKFRPFRKINRGGGGNLKFSFKPTRTTLVFFFSILFLFLCIVAYSFQSIFPKFKTGGDVIVSPKVGSSSLGVFNTALKDKNIQFDTMKVATESPTLVVFLSNGGYAYLDLNTNPETQTALLSRILSRILVDNPNKKVKYIDLRHEKAIVGFQSP